MSSNVSSKSYRINVKNLVYAVLKEDTKNTVTYDTVKQLSEAMKIQITPSVAAGKLHGDGAEVENISKLKGLAVAIDATKIKIEDKAVIQGHKYENGVMIEKAGDEAPYIAVGYMIEGTNKKNEYVWLLKGRAQPMNETVTQMEENINFSTDTININFIKRDKDDEIRYYADSANAALTEAQIAKWFTEAPVTYPAAGTQ